jgi:hypothetical protein
VLTLGLVLQGPAPIPGVLPLVTLQVQARHEVGSVLQWWCRQSCGHEPSTEFLDVVRIEAKFRNRMRQKKHKNLSNNKSKIISIKIVKKKILNRPFLGRLASYSQQKLWYQFVTPI